MATIQELAQTLSRHFTGFSRGSENETQWKLDDDAPEWCLDVVRDCHGNLLPDDDVYRWCAYAAQALAEDEDDEDAPYNWPSVYTHDRIMWMSRHNRIDDVQEEIDQGHTSLFDAIGFAMAKECAEVFWAMRSALESLAESEAQLG